MRSATDMKAILRWMLLVMPWLLRLASYRVAVVVIWHYFAAFPAYAATYSFISDIPVGPFSYVRMTGLLLLWVASHLAVIAGLVILPEAMTDLFLGNRKTS